MIKLFLRLILTLFIVTFLTFAAFELVSGNPARTILGTEATQEQVEQLRNEMGLDRPFMERYFDWIANCLRGDFGTSYSYRQPVGDLISSKAYVSLTLSLMSFVIIVLVSIPLGMVSYRWTGKFVTTLRTTVNQICMAVPPFFSAILFSWFFGIVLKLFIPGDTPTFLHYFFAALCIAIPRIAMTVRLFRSTVVSEMNKAYVRTAISRGNDRKRVMLHHTLKNSMAGVVSFLGQTLAELVGATIVVEQVMGLPGLGRFLVTSVLHRDYPVIQAIALILALWVVLAGALADMVNMAIDPRLRDANGGKLL